MNVIRKIIFLTTLCGVVSGLCAQNISISTTKTSLVLSAPVGEELKYIYYGTLVSGKKLRVIKKASFDDTLITWPNQLLCPLKETV